MASFLGFGFWREVAKRPDAALQLFRVEPGCIVDGKRRPGFTGPYVVVDSLGAQHEIFVRVDLIGDIKTRLDRELRGQDSARA